MRFRSKPRLLLREGYEVYAVDPDVRAVESVRALARMLAPALPASNFRVEAVEQMSFDDAARMSSSATPSSISRATTRTSRPCCADHGAY